MEGGNYINNNFGRSRNENGFRAREGTGNPRQKKRMSGSARRIRQRQRALNATDRSGSGHDDKVPVGVPKKTKLSTKEPGSLSAEAFELVRQKLVASLMEVLPRTHPSGNWNQNNSNALIPFNASPNHPSSSNGASMRGFNSQLSWNNNFSQSAMNNNFSQSAMNNNFSQSARNNDFSQSARNNNLSQSARNPPSDSWNQQRHMGEGRNDNCPAPPAWGHNNQSVMSTNCYDSMWGNDLGNPDGGNGLYDKMDNKSDEYEERGGEIKFAIVDMNQPKGKITGIRQELLKNAFNEALADLILNADNRIPPIQIQYSSFVADTYKVTVKSRQCAEVLQNLVDGLASPWPGSKLRLVPLQGRVKLYRTSLYLRSGGISRSSEDILLILERQNAGLQTDKWHIFFRKEKEDAILLIIGIDRQTVEYLERNAGRVYFLTSTAVFRVGKDLGGRRRRRNSERGDKPEDAEDGNRLEEGGRAIRERRRERRPDNERNRNKDF